MVAANAPQSIRRSTGPQTAKGAATRAQLLVAARATFGRLGYLETRVTDIVSAAGVAQGTFYAYFTSKEDVFRHVAIATIQGMLAALHTDTHETPPSERVSAAMRRFVKAYRDNASMIAIIEQTAASSDEMRALLNSMNRAFIDRTVRGIQRLVEEGAISLPPDAELIAELLGSMLDRTCYLWFCAGRDYDEDAIIESLTLVWSRAIGLTVGS